MLFFVDGLAPPQVLAAIGAAEPLTQVCGFRYPESRWRRYDKMRSFPAGPVVFGDAFLNFNPNYRQGMTVDALQAQALNGCLRNGGVNGLARRFFAASAKHLRVAWHTAVGSDLALPEVVGVHPISMRISNAYLEHVLTAAEADLDAARQFLRVSGMIDSPLRLLHPRFLLRIALANRRQQPTSWPRDNSPDPLDLSIGRG